MTYSELRQQFAVPQIALGIVNIAVNSFFIHAARKLGKFRQLSYKIVLCLIISQLASGVNMITEETFTLAVIRDETSTLRLAFRLVFFLIAQFSSIMMIAIAVDRYVHVRYLYKYRQVMTKRILLVFIAFGLLSGLFIVVILSLGFIYKAVFYSSLVLCANALAVYITILVIYARAYKELITRTRDFNFQLSTIRPQRSANKDFATATLAILVSLIVAFTPYFALSLALSYSAEIEKIAEPLAIYKAWLMSVVLVKTQTIFDTILFITFDRNVRSYTRRLLCTI